MKKSELRKLVKETILRESHLGVGEGAQECIQYAIQYMTWAMKDMDGELSDDLEFISQNIDAIGPLGRKYHSEIEHITKSFYDAYHGLTKLKKEFERL